MTLNKTVNSMEWFALLFGLKLTSHSGGDFTFSLPLSNRGWNIFNSIHFRCMINGRMLLFSLLLSLCDVRRVDIRSQRDGLFTSLVVLFYAEEAKKLRAFRLLLHYVLDVTKSCQPNAVT